MFKVTQLLSGYLATAIEERVAQRGRPIFGAKLKGWRHKMFHIFHSLQFDVVFGVKKNPFS